MKAEWRSALMTSGVQFVMTSGVMLMQEWFVLNLGLDQVVSLVCNNLSY